MIPNLVLASTSRYRRELLARLGLPFRAVAPACDEEALKTPDLAPEALAAKLARAKAESLRAAEPGAVIIGSDQLAAIDGVILGKPGTPDRAEAQLAMLAGRTHALVTAVAVAHPGGVIEHLDVTRLTMRPLSAAQIARYVAADAPTDCAGAYKLEARGIALFSGIEAEDHSAITGLPLIALTTILASLGFPVP
ncbi:MAG: nucleoside triphosphate pyrophosphatase [Minicystis sp.]